MMAGQIVRTVTHLINDYGNNDSCVYTYVYYIAQAVGLQRGLCATLAHRAHLAEINDQHIPSFR